MTIDNLIIRVDGTRITYQAIGGSVIIVELNDLLTKFEDAGANIKNPSDVFNYCIALKGKIGELDELDEERRNNLYKENPNGVLLSKVFDEKLAFCREYAVLAHILLAQIGVPSRIISASSRKMRHAFVVFRTNNEITILDAALGYYGLLKNNLSYIDYNQDVIFHELFEPREQLENYENF